MGYISSQTLRSIAPAMRLEGSRPPPGLHGSPSDANGSRECAPPTSASARAEMTGSASSGDGTPRGVLTRDGARRAPPRRTLQPILKGSKSGLASRCLAGPVMLCKLPLPEHSAHGLTSCRSSKTRLTHCRRAILSRSRLQLRPPPPALSAVRVDPALAAVDAACTLTG